MLAEATGALADQTELILLTHSPQSGIQFGKTRPPPTGQQHAQHPNGTAAAKAIEVQSTELNRQNRKHNRTSTTK